MRIEILTPDAARVRELLDDMRAMPAQLRVQALLFGGDRWACVEVCALALRDQQAVGLATLAPTDEVGAGGPQIIGVWVRPDQRRQGLGTALLVALAAEAQRRYGQPATVVCVSPAGLAAARRAVRTGATLQIVDAAAVCPFA